MNPVPAPQDYQRATHYFGERQLMQLEIMMLRCRTDLDRKIGKSQAMRAALDFLLADFEANREGSFLIRHFDQYKDGPA